MVPRSLLVGSSVLYAAYGLVFVVAPGLILGLVGAMSMEPLTDRLLGGALLGLAVINWFARKAATPETTTAIVAGNLTFAAIGFVATLVAQLSGDVNVIGWTSVGVTLFLAAAFGTAMLTGRRRSVAPAEAPGASA